MYLLGHADPTLTMCVYEQVIDMGDVETDAEDRYDGPGGAVTASAAASSPRAVMPSLGKTR
jgi:hypothetical protein